MDSLQSAFRALSDPTRRDILAKLADHDMTIAEVAENYEMTRAAVKKHLTILNEGGFVNVQVRGRERVNQFNADGFALIVDWISYFDQFWDGRLDDLKTAIERNNNGN